MSSRRSQVSVKAEIARKRRYPDADKAMFLEGGTGGKVPPPEVLDAIAEDWINAGWHVAYVTDEQTHTRSIDRSTLCRNCGLALTALGTCPVMCDE